MAATVVVATTDQACPAAINITAIRGDTADPTAIIHPRQHLKSLHHQEHLVSGLECHPRHHQPAITTSHMTIAKVAHPVTINIEALHTPLMLHLATMALATLRMGEAEAQEAIVRVASTETGALIGSWAEPWRSSI